ncbi:uncharacterized protein BJX67DRAFT_167098 [Aspergillus lucknowensis]|uniref:DUF7587 domain-containing protein n=1 Tax=Aspergillus lucknowensis TaxID=176173 RepID=A0ABR4M522_9EURO
MPGTYVEPPTEQVSFPFDPSPLQRDYLPLFNQNFTPRYLYRLVAPQTAGTTSSSAVIPPSVQTSPPDIFHLPAPKAANLLLNHLLWQRGHEDGCNLMSWTTSLLFALQYALYRHRKDGDDLRYISLIIIDTTLFPAGTFIQDMEIMRCFQAADTRMQKFVEYRQTEYYFGEYLTQGRLNVEGRCVCTPVQRMISLGLFELQPALADTTQWHCWPKRVLDYRELFTSARCVPATEEDVEIAVDIATQCFGGKWTAPGVLMLLALQPRKRADKIIGEGFKSRFTEAEIKEAALHRVKIESRRLPEVAQFKVLVAFIQRIYSLSEYETVVRSVQRLSVDESE